jgi:MFS family permease
LFTNIFVILGSAISILADQVEGADIYLQLAGRFLYGLSAGAFSVYCPKYISETAPIEIKGPAGCLSQICVTFGILVAYIPGFIFDAT